MIEVLSTDNISPFGALRRCLLRHGCMSESIELRRSANEGFASIVRVVRPYVELTKPRLATLLLIITLGTYHVAVHVRRAASFGSADGLGFATAGATGQVWIDFAILAVSVVLYASGMFALNHYLERDIDGLMARTARRPLPSGRLNPDAALLFGIGCSILGTLALTLWVNTLAGVLAVLNLVIYLGIYTPLKRRTPVHTALGAFAGAMPPLVGWTAATGELSPEAWALAAIVFAWQFPHFYAVQLKNLKGYRNANVKVLPVTDEPGKRVRFEIIFWTVATLGASLLPIAVGLTRMWYAVPAVVLWVLFAYRAFEVCRSYDVLHARKLLRSSVIYLPCLFVFIGLAIL